MTFLFPLKNQQQGTMEGRPSGPARVSSMFRRLMMVRVTPAERLAGDGKEREKDEKAAAAGAEADVGSVALDKMVLSFMEESSAVVERPPRGRCSNCFNGNQDDISDDEDFGFLPSASFPAAPPAAAGDALVLLKGLVQCASTAERNLLADASRVADRSGKGSGRKKADVRRAVADGLRGLGYDAQVCTSRWDKTPSHPAGEHQYIDVVLVVGSGSSSSAAASAGGDGVRLVVEVDFRKEFEVARPTKAYRAALQALPPLFVGTTDRLGAIVGVVAEAARQSLRKRGLHFPPWRKHEYMRAKWLSPYERSSGGGPDSTPPLPPPALELATPISAANFSGEFQLLFEETPKSATAAAAADDIPGGEDDGADETKITVVVSPKAKPEEPGAASSSSKVSPPPPQPPQGKQKAVTGLAALLLLAS